MNCHRFIDQHTTADTKFQHRSAVPCLPRDCFCDSLQDLAQKEGRAPVALCHLHAFACRATVLHILKHKLVLNCSKTKPAGSCSSRQILLRELQSPHRLPNSRLHHPILWNRKLLIIHFLEAICMRIWVKLLFLSQRAELAFLTSRGQSGCEVPNHLWRDFGDLEPGPCSEMTIITVSIRKRVLPYWL